MSGEGDDIERRSPDALTPHPENEQIYGDRKLDGEADAGFIESVREKGVLTPIIIDQDDCIISGHRRVEAAKAVGLETVPVTTREFDSELERLEQLIELNRQREKTVSQKLHEAETLERIERERAHERQGTRTDTSCSDEQEVDGGLARDKVAKKVGFGSGSTYHRAKTVWEAREDDEPEVSATADQQLDQMDAGEQSINGAYSEVMDARRRATQASVENEESDSEPEVGESEDSSDGTESSHSSPVLLQGDAGSLPLPDESVDVIITSPPYNLGHERWAMGWRSMRDEGVGYYDDRPEDEYQEWQRRLLREWHRVDSEGASLFYVHKVRIDGGEVIHPASGSSMETIRGSAGRRSSGTARAPTTTSRRCSRPSTPESTG